MKVKTIYEMSKVALAYRAKGKKNAEIERLLSKFTKSELEAYYALQQYEPWMGLTDDHISHVEIKGEMPKRVFEEISKLTHLRYFQIYNSPISKIEVLDKLTQITCLGFNNTAINKIEGLDKLTQLEILRIDSSDINKIE